MKFNKFLLAFIFSFTIIFSGFTACDTTGNNESDGNARLTVQLTDAPGDFDAVFVDIQSVRVHRNEDAETDSTDSDDEAEEDGFITITQEPVRVNLLELRNGNTIQLGDEELEAGEYNQIRLILGPDNEVVIDGESFPLKTPSAQQSGLKLKIDADIEEGEIYNLLVDFDASRSIVETGNGKFILKPVLRAVELEETGSIEGEVAPSDFQTSVMAIANGDTLFTLTGEEGEFAIIGLTPGTYDIVFDPNNDAFVDTTITDVTVEIDEDVDLGTVTLQEL
jgi:hypothetical protein